ncbi:MAG: glycosyltransferase [Spirochaetales bacterium]|nr:glycosyltransferase [Spirochaetales bacterium]
MTSVQAINIIVPFRNRSPEILEQLWLSLCEKTSVPFEFVVSDYGSHPEIAEKLNELASRRGFRIVRSETQGLPFSKAKAVNVAVKETKLPWILHVDADMVFFQTQLEALVGYLDESQVLLAESYWPQSSRQKPKNGKVFRSPGVFLLLHRNWFERLDGFCESFEFWGAEDSEWLDRLILAGCRPRWLTTQEITLYHSWHTRENSRIYRPYTAETRALEIQVENIWKGYRNNRWGTLVTSKDRPVLSRMGEAIEIDLFQKKETEWVGQLKSLLNQGRCVKLNLGPRKIKRIFSAFQRIAYAFDGLFNLFGLRLDYATNDNLEKFLSLRKMVGPELLDMYLEADYSSIFVVQRK